MIPTFQYYLVPTLQYYLVATTEVLLIQISGVIQAASEIQPVQELLEDQFRNQVRNQQSTPLIDYTLLSLAAIKNV